MFSHSLSRNHWIFKRCSPQAPTVTNYTPSSAGEDRFRSAMCDYLVSLARSFAPLVRQYSTEDLIHYAIRVDLLKLTYQDAGVELVPGNENLNILLEAACEELKRRETAEGAPTEEPKQRTYGNPSITDLGL